MQALVLHDCVRRILAHTQFPTLGFAFLITGVLLGGATPAARAQEAGVSLEGSGDRRSDLYRPRMSSFLVGSSSYSSATQMVPEFAGGAAQPSDPQHTFNFRFDKFGIAVAQRLTPWLFGSAAAEIESHRDAHTHGRDPAFACPGTTPCVEQFGAEEPEIVVGLDRFDITAAIPIGNRPTVAIGRFDVPFGFERHDEPLLLTATPSDLFRFGRPMKMTGLLAGYQFAPWLDVAAWLVNRWESETTHDDFNDNNKSKSLGGRLGLTLPGMFNIGVGGWSGSEQEAAYDVDMNDTRAQNKRWIVDLDVSWAPMRRLFVTGEFVHGKEDSVEIRERGAPFAAPAAEKDVTWTGWYALGHYDIADWFGLSVRYSVLDDPDGGRTGVEQKLQSLTLAPVFHLSRISSGLGLTGANYARSRHPVDAVDLRLEYRLNSSDRPVFSDAVPATNILTADKTGYQFSIMLVVNSLFR